MNRDELVYKAALAISTTKDQGNLEPTERELHAASLIVDLVEQVAIDNRRKRVDAFLEEGRRQAETLYADTGHSIWLGKIIAYTDVIEAAKYGAFGGV